MGLLILGLPVLAAAVTLAKLSKPDHPSYFVLESDHVRVQVKGLLKYKWVEGLRAGSYKAVARDAKGTYYMGTGACVLMLTNKLAENYLANGDVPPEGPGLQPLEGAGPGVGGLYIPFDVTNGEPALFIIDKVDSAAVPGILSSVIVSALLDGKIEYIKFGTEKAFVNSLKITEEP